MNVLSWLTGRFSKRGKALSLYRQGMAKSKRHEHEGAIDDYTMVIEMQDAPPDVIAMALYNRALVYAAAGDRPKAKSDLNTVLGMQEALPKIKDEARRKVVRMER